MRAVESGRRNFDVVSFTTAIRRSPGIDHAERWYDEMKSAGVSPNVFTFSTLIDKAPTAERAEHWHNEMKSAGVSPKEQIATR